MTTEERPKSGVAANDGTAESAGERPSVSSGFGRSSVSSARFLAEARERYDDAWYEEYIRGAVEMNGPLQLPLMEA